MRRIIILCSIILMPIGLFAANEVAVAHLDSLFVKMEESVNTDLFLPAIDKLYESSRSLGERRYEEWACLSYIYYSYVHNDKQGVHDWYARLERLVDKSKDYPELFMGRYLKVRLYNLIGEPNAALAEMNRAYTEANELGDPYCESLTCLGFANIYIKTKQYREAKDMIRLAFPGGLPAIWRTPLEVLALDILACLAYAEGEEELLLRYLDEMDDYLRSEKVGREVLPPYYVSFIYGMTEFTHCRLLALYHLDKGNVKEAKVSVAKVDEFVGNSTNKNLWLDKHALSVSYYTVTGAVDSALIMLDQVVAVAGELNSNVSRLRFLWQKADLLFHKGAVGQALPVYRQVVQLQDSINKDSYTRKVGEFHVQLKAKKIEIDNEQLRTRQNLLYGEIFLLSLLCFLLIVLAFVIYRIRCNLLRTKKKAERSERLKSIFLANMNHEIRTPLNAITGFCDLLTDETDADICEQYIGIIESNNELLLRLINDVVDITKIEAGMVEFSYSEINLADLMEGLYNTFKIRMEEGVELVLDAVADVRLYTDKDRLAQVIMNLLTNAAKHTPSGSIRLGFEVIGDQVRFYVIDTGKGIAESEQLGIFTRFVQGKDDKGGVGLGLALCKGFVSRMGGDIGVESKVGEGSAFWFTLPYQSGK